MGSVKKSTWIGGTAFVAVVMLALTWFLVVSPTMSTASDTRAQADTIRQQNVVLKQKVDLLKTQFAHIGDYKADLAELQKGIPAAADMSAYLKQIDTLATKAGVTVVTVTPQAAQAVTFIAGTGTHPGASGGSVSTEAPAASPSPSPSASAAGSTAAAGTPAPASAAAVAPKGMTALPMTIEVVGSYDDVLQFVAGLQSTPRLFLVSGLKGSAEKDGKAQGGKPETHVGDLDLVISGFAYALPQDAIPAVAKPGAKPAPAPSPSATAAPVLPKPKESANPLVPVEGAPASSDGT